MTNLALKLEPAETALTFVEDGLVLTNSKTVSAVFNKRHCDVLEAIKRLEIPEDLRKRNFPLTFNEVKMPNGAIRKDPCYNLTKDGFVLLVMGFTGKKAMTFKIKYIEAFNAMERALKAQLAAPDKPVTVSEHTRSLPSGKKEIVLSEKAKQEIGGIVKACAAKAIKDELADIIGYLTGGRMDCYALADLIKTASSPLKAAGALKENALKDLIRDVLREELVGFLLKDGVTATEPFNGNVTADGLPAANWALSIVHGASALQSIIGQMTDKQKEAVKLLA